MASKLNTWVRGVTVAAMLATTNANGVATLAPPTEYRGDHFNFEARFAGNDNYEGSGDFYQT